MIAYLLRRCLLPSKVPSYLVFNNILIHRNAYERFNSYFYELTNILIHRNAYVHRANSVTTFRLPCMEESRVNRPWNVYGKFNSFIWRSKLYSAQCKHSECFSKNMPSHIYWWIRSYHILLFLISTGSSVGTLFYA